MVLCFWCVWEERAAIGLCVSSELLPLWVVFMCTRVRVRACVCYKGWAGCALGVMLGLMLGLLRCPCSHVQGQQSHACKLCMPCMHALQASAPPAAPLRTRCAAWVSSL